MSSKEERHAEMQRRYERILELRFSTVPPMSYQEIGRQLEPPLSKQRVQAILKRPPRPEGRPAREETR